MKTKYSPGFIKKLKQAHVIIRKNFRQKIKLFGENPFEPSLNNHDLKREYEGLKSIDITADVRAIYKEITEESKTVAYFLKLGTHNELYK
ncbi:MAG TPA: hypothetical protein VNA13_00690 [Xanthomonadales bacterium]|nr:hypothetical protein [Xanthomonadales bacterium]